MLQQAELLQPLMQLVAPLSWQPLQHLHRLLLSTTSKSCFTSSESLKLITVLH